MRTFHGAAYRAQHFLWEVQDGVATLTLNRPERKNPLTFDSYGEIRDLFRELRHAKDVKVVVLRGAGDNFCSGGDVHEIIGPLVRMQEAGDMGGLLEFTRMTGDAVIEMRHCPQPIIAAVDGVCAGAGAILAMAADLGDFLSKENLTSPAFPEYYSYQVHQRRISDIKDRKFTQQCSNVQAWCQ